MKKFICKFLSLVTLLSSVANICPAIFAVSEEARLNEMLRPKTLSDCLCKAVSDKDYELVEYILNNTNCNVNDKNYYGDLPLYIAVCNYSFIENENDREKAEKIVDLLLTHNADPTLTHEKGISVLELFTMADRGNLKNIFKHYGYDVYNYSNSNQDLEINK